MSQQPELSIVIPFYNEEDNVVPVLQEVLRCQPEAEVIAVDDGSKDKTWDGIRSVPGVTGLRLTQNRGQSGAVYAGLRAARGTVVATMDGDGQNDPADYAKMLDVIRAGQADLVCGLRAKRKDTWSRRAASKAANWIRRRFLDDGVKDTGCGLKMFRREHVELLVPFNGLHRYVPAIFKSAGLRLAEVPVNHRPRTAGTSKYTNWERALRGMYDLIGVGWLLKRKVVYPKIERAEAGQVTSDR